MTNDIRKTDPPGRSLQSLDDLRNRLGSLEKKLQGIPSFKLMDRRLTEMLIEGVKKRIREKESEIKPYIPGDFESPQTDQVLESSIEEAPGHTAIIDQQNGVSGSTETGKVRESRQENGRFIWNIRQGIARLAILAGISGVILGWFHAQKALRYVPDERYQHEVFESLMSSPVVKQTRSRLISLKAVGVDPPSSTDVIDDRIRSIFWKEDCSVDFFAMQDGGIVESGPSPSIWLYSLWIVYPALGFVFLWGLVRSIGWVINGFMQQKTL